VNPDDRQSFCDAARRYLPGIACGQLQPEMAGIRPKLQRPGDPARDFIIQEESARGLPGVVNLIGIESPGLTASAAIAQHVAGLLHTRNS
jgi:L-2-hydroxyglutarate oxidase LhgO